MPYAIAALAVAAMVAAAGWFGYRTGSEHERVQHQATAELVRQAAEATRKANAEDVAKALAGIRIQHRTIRQEVEREIVERKVYADCRHSPDGLRSINAALTGGARPDAAAADPAGLPASGAAGR